MTVSRPSRLVSPGLSCLLAVVLLIGKLYGSYAPVWAVGILAAFWIFGFGRGVDRVALGIWFLIALWPDGLQGTLGVRASLFLAMFVFFARYCQINPIFLISVNCMLMFFTSYVGIQSVASFAFAPSVLFALMSMRQMVDGASRRWLKAGSFSLASLLFASVDFGSRSAILVWLVTLLRQNISAALAILVVVALAMPAATDLPIASKLANSVSEIREPYEDSGAVNLRAIENLIFLEYAVGAGPMELILGAKVSTSVPGELVGMEADSIYLPHNQLFGVVYQAGLVGLGALIVILVGLYRHFSGSRDRQIFYLALIPPFFFLKHGFLDVDFALLLAGLNWYRCRRGGG